LNSVREYVRLAYKVSRPRFWFYLTGPFTVGCIWGADRFLDLATPEFFLYLFYFLFPANILLYGVNDYWDQETDLLNPKKKAKEYLVGDGDRARLKRLLKAILIFSVVLLFFQKNVGEWLIFGSFLFLSYFYSARPLRFKAVQFLDFSSNVLYALPGVFAYYQVKGLPPPGLVVVAAFLHTSAMHLFSAIPDIEWDRSAGLVTTAVLLGERASMLLCLGLWSGFSAIVFTVGNGSLMALLTLVYPAIVLTLLIRRGRALSTYWFYPHINTGLGGLLFLIGAAQTPFA
jgi:4-hydroxybenzoate polyprenyltransferase